MKWLALGLLACLACGKSNSLEGSLSQDVSLSFDQIQFEMSTDAVALEYLRAIPGATGSDVVFKLTADTTGLDLSKPIDIDLTTLDGTAERGQCERLVSGDTRTSLPAIGRGTLHLESAAASGSEVSGSFNVLFANSGSGALGAGETVFGDFSATVEEAK